MRRQRTISGARILALLPVPVLCVFAALLGSTAPHLARGVALEALSPIQSTGWGDRSAPAGSHQFEQGRVRAQARPGFQSGYALPAASGFAVPAGTVPLALSAGTPLLAQRTAGAHSGRSPPRNS